MKKTLKEYIPLDSFTSNSCHFSRESLLVKAVCFRIYVKCGQTGYFLLFSTLRMARTWIHISGGCNPSVGSEAKIWREKICYSIWLSITKDIRTKQAQLNQQNHQMPIYSLNRLYLSITQAKYQANTTRITNKNIDSYNLLLALTYY